MNHDSFKHIERLFHELRNLDSSARAQRLQSLRVDDPERATLLEGMLDASSTQGPFLDVAVVESHLPRVVDIPLDGSVVLGERYTLVGHLGAGGSSTVLRARMKKPDRDVAVKVLRSGIHSSAAHERFARESQALAALTHPHIAHIYETGVHNFSGTEVPWIAMEQVRGACTLRRFALDKNRDQDSRRELFQFILGAIQSAHEQGVLHLDINSSNVLVDQYGHPKVIDFGLTGLVGGGLGSGHHHVGTRISMAPEQAHFEKPEFSERTDMYALALLYIELVHGVQLQAFRGRSDDEAKKLISEGYARESLDEIRSLSVDEHALLAKMLSVNPDDRPSCIAEVISQLNSIWAQRRERETPVRVIAVLGGALFLALAMVILSPVMNQETEYATPAVEQQVGDPAIKIPAGIAMELSLRDPRSTLHEASLERAIQGIAEALENEESLTPVESGRLHAALGDRFRAAGQNEDSIRQYRLAIDAFEQAERPSDRVHLQIRLVDLLLFLGRFSEASYELGIIEREHISIPVLSLDLSIAEAGLAIAQEHADTALDQLRAALRLAESLPPASQPLQIERLVTIAQLGSQLGDTELMRAGFSRARRVAEAVSAEYPEQVALVDMAFAKSVFSLHDPQTHSVAIEQAKAAVEELAHGEDRFHYAWGLRQTAHMHMSSGEPEIALDLYTEAFRVMHQTLGNNHHETVLCDAYLGLAAKVVEGDESQNALRFVLALNDLRTRMGREHDVVLNLEGACERAAARYGILCEHDSLGDSN